MKRTTATQVSLIAVPDAAISTLSGLYDVLNCFDMLAGMDDAIPRPAPFAVQIVGERRGPLMLASGMPIEVRTGIDEVTATDVVIVPSVVVGEGGWRLGRYPALVAWLTRMHARGAVLCSACSGVFVLAETGLFDGVRTTVHWGYANAFRTAFPRVPVMPEHVLLVGGERGNLVSSGASHTWADLALYLVARYAGPPAAQSVAKFFALQWHREGMAPYMKLDFPTAHGDAAIADAQAWLARNFAGARPVEEMVARSRLAERTFKRRFTQATGHAPIVYVQRLRIEEAKRRLERTEETIEHISWQVGYEDASYFRRLFRRHVGVSPQDYRRKFQIPAYAADRPPATGLARSA